MRTTRPLARSSSDIAVSGDQEHRERCHTTEAYATRSSGAEPLPGGSVSSRDLSLSLSRGRTPLGGPTQAPWVTFDHATEPVRVGNRRSAPEPVTSLGCHGGWGSGQQDSDRLARKRPGEQNREGIVRPALPGSSARRGGADRPRDWPGTTDPPAPSEPDVDVPLRVAVCLGLRRSPSDAQVSWIAIGCAASPPQLIDPCAADAALRARVEQSNAPHAPRLGPECDRTMAFRWPIVSGWRGTGVRTLPGGVDRVRRAHGQVQA